MAWRTYGADRYGMWRPYVPVWKRRLQGEKKARELAKKGRAVEPVVIEGRTIAHTFWGRSWCENLEGYSDFENRLPRGRTYARNGSVIHLQVESGAVKALVSGYQIYDVEVKFAALARRRWAAIKAACSGKIDSVIELLEGKLSRGVMEVLTAQESGLFPSPAEIEMECSCPDWATMCKHVAAVLYGVGARLDARPDLLFLLRGVDQAELVRKAVAGAARLGQGDGAAAMAPDEMEKVFGIEIDAGAARPAAPEPAAAGPAPALPEPPAVRARPPRRRSTPGKRPRPAGGGRDPSDGLAALEARLPCLRRFFRGKLDLTNSDYRGMFSVGTAAASRELCLLTARGVLERIGKKRGTRYIKGDKLGRG